MLVKSFCWIVFYCAPIFNILCSNEDTSEYTHEDTINKSISNIFETNISTSYNSIIAFEYSNYDYSYHTFIFERWFGRENMESFLWNIDNFMLLSFKWIYEYFLTIYENQVYYEMQYNDNHIWFFGINSIMNLINYVIIYAILYLVSSKFKLLRFDFKMYVVSNISKALILSYLVMYCGSMIKTIILDDWADTFWKNCAMLYASTDFISLFTVSRNKTSTIIHHVCTVAICLLCVCIGSFNNYLWKALILYGMFSALACGANAFLGIRFLTTKESTLMIIFNYVVAVTYIICCACNWSIQIYYLIYYIPLSVMSILYMACVFFFVRDDIMLIKFQLMYYFNINKIKDE